MKKIGLIAGRGNFPVLFTQQAKKQGYRVCVVAVRGNTKAGIRNYADTLDWIKVTEFKRISAIFRDKGVSEAAMAGQINPRLLFKPKVMACSDIREFFGRMEDLRADTIFKAFAQSLQNEGFNLLDSTMFMADYMPVEGALSKRVPSEAEYKDINFGFEIAKHLGQMDIGQSVCVKNGIILAVESIEGTDMAVKRAKGLVRSALVLVKASKPRQDMRFDVPVVGLNTIKNLPPRSCLAIESAKTLFLDKDKAVALADKKSIAIISVT